MIQHVFFFFKFNDDVLLYLLCESIRSSFIINFVKYVGFIYIYGGIGFTFLILSFINIHF